MDALPEAQAIPEAIRLLEGKYLTFGLGDEEYGINILQVREIIGELPITAVPQTPPYVRGVTNLRGKIIPVVDLRLRFGMAAALAGLETCIIVVEVHHTLIGVVVDQVSEVLLIHARDIEPTPALGAQRDAASIMGIAKVKGRVMMLLQIEEVLGGKEFVFVQS
ncbi:MAG: purine-binding chemotaxis protein CheW [Candidatus Tectomicrobia bacterium]|nr:purine-binding chemotaxis protein CheW [Candidatus Tectomicrobia bacterium]